MSSHYSDLTIQLKAQTKILERMGRAEALNKVLLDAIEQVLTASEDNGDMEDIDWNMLRAAVAKAKEAP